MKTMRLGSILVLSASVAVLAACTSSTPNRTAARSVIDVPGLAPANRATASQQAKEYFSEAQYGKASPRVTTKRSNLKRGGGREQVGKPYQIRGKWYYPKEEPGYVRTGNASWYGDAFHGRLTANGEIYDMTHLTAAHPTMPLPSYARVTNTKNGASVIVRVNDRGPYSRARVIDLSRRGAEMLGYVRDGTAKVKVEYVGRAPLHGQDEQYLMASYVPGNVAPDPSVGMPTGVMVAMDGTSPGGAGQGAAPKSQPFPGQLTTATAPEAGIAAPDAGADILRKPSDEIALATASYSAGPREGAASVALGRLATSGPDSSYVMVGSFRSRAEADRLGKALNRVGIARTEPLDGPSGARWYSLTLRSDGRHDVDAMLQAAWNAGAPDAMTVRD